MSAPVKYRAFFLRTRELLPVENIEFGADKYSTIITAGGRKEYLASVELMQFIGETDIKGKEIYCGDVIKAKSDKEPFSEDPVYEDVQGVVNFANCCFQCAGDNPTYLDDKEVIGNIYQNPELLK